MLSDAATIFLLDVDNTLLDNDGFAADLGDRLERCFGAAQRARYWDIFARRRTALGLADYLGSLQEFRAGLDDDPRLLDMSQFLLEYPFASRLFPGALEAIAHLRSLGSPAVLSDGDIVFQPRKIQRSGIWDAVEGRVMIYVHKEKVLDHVQLRFPAEHYVMVDDKANLLGGNESGAGRATDDGIRASRALCAGRRVTIGGARARSGDRAHRRSSQSQLIRIQGATMSMTKSLHELGQSLWLDNITREILDDGTLRRYIEQFSVTGLTSNPTIFDEAIGKTSAYDQGIRQKAAAGLSGENLFIELALEDLRRAADLFRPEFDRTKGTDGWVSMEVSPLAGERHSRHDRCGTANSPVRQIGPTSM